MAAYDLLLGLVKEYFVSLGFNPIFAENYFSPKHFKELACIKLANANVMIRNKSDHTSHQTHIAITGEMIDFFCANEQFKKLDNSAVLYWNVSVARINLDALANTNLQAQDPFSIELLDGKVSWGKRTQSQIQLSKKNLLNSDCFNRLRLGLFENDLLVMLKYRNDERFLAIGIPQIFYLDVIPGFDSKYETNTYLRLSYSNQN